MVDHQSVPGGRYWLLGVHVHVAEGEELVAPYERLLGDAMRADPELFARQDAIEAAWRVVNPVLGDALEVQDYDPGSWGPAAADRLAADVGGWQERLHPGGAPAGTSTTRTEPPRGLSPIGGKAALTVSRTGSTDQARRATLVGALAAYRTR